MITVETTARQTTCCTAKLRSADVLPALSALGESRPDSLENSNLVRGFSSFVAGYGKGLSRCRSSPENGTPDSANAPRTLKKSLTIEAPLGKRPARTRFVEHDPSPDRSHGRHKAASLLISPTACHSRSR